MDRKVKTISDKTGKMLVEQVSHELFNHNLYRSIANFFAVEGIPDLEKYYIKRAEEELVHHRWIVDRLNETDFDFQYLSVDAVHEKFNNYTDPFKRTVEVEIETTEAIHAITKSAMEDSDWQTVTWLQQHLIPEQHEEESTSRTALDIIQNDESSIYRRAQEILNLLS